MSVADKLEKLTTDINSAYSAVEEKGGTIPEHKNTENLSSAIGSIEGGNDESYPAPICTDYGAVLMYASTQTSVETEYAEECSATVNKNIFKEYIETNPIMEMGGDEQRVDFDYNSEEQTWQSWSFEQPVEGLTSEELATQLGITVTLNEGAEWAMFELTVSKKATGQKNWVAFVDEQEMTDFLTNMQQESSATVGGQTYERMLITGFTFGKLVEKSEFHFSFNGEGVVDLIDFTYAESLEKLIFNTSQLIIKQPLVFPEGLKILGFYDIAFSTPAIVLPSSLEALYGGCSAYSGGGLIKTIVFNCPTSVAVASVTSSGDDIVSGDHIIFGHSAEDITAVARWFLSGSIFCEYLGPYANDWQEALPARLWGNGGNRIRLGELESLSTGVVEIKGVSKTVYIGDGDLYNTSISSGNNSYIGALDFAASAAGNNVLYYDPDENFKQYYIYRSSFKTINLGKSKVTSISISSPNSGWNYGFMYKASNLTGIVLPPNLTIIGENFLHDCTSFNQPLVIPETVKTIGAYFLAYCSSFNSSIELSNTETIYRNFLYSCSKFNQPLTIPNTTTSIGAYFLTGCGAFNQPLVIPDSITYIPSFFLTSCTSFNQPITFSNTLVNIYDNFLTSCTSYNQPITFPSSLKIISGFFLRNCTSFNQPITIPSTITNVAGYFLNNCKNMTSTVTCEAPTTVIESGTEKYTFATDNPSSASYTTGITLNGTYASDWKTKLPDSDTSPYRKLILVS